MKENLFPNNGFEMAELVDNVLFNMKDTKGKEAKIHPIFENIIDNMTGGLYKENQEIAHDELSDDGELVAIPDEFQLTAEYDEYSSQKIDELAEERTLSDIKFMINYLEGAKKKYELRFK